MEIISHLPLKLAVQCKVVSKNLNHWISDAKFSHTLFQHQKVNTLFFSSGGASVIRRELQRIFRNGRLIVPTIQHQTTSHPRFRVISVCNGLLLLDFIELGTFCVFNPVTGSHQLILYPQHYRHMRCGQAGLFVDYPVSDQYKLITVERLDQGKGYKFHLLSSSSSSGLWHEFQINNNSKPVHLHDSLHWLTATGRILSFDIKRQEATILDPPQFAQYSS
ncbi:hypothetical protein HAX54_013875 [Datura stramonium]|uniref:F-box associated beta-propeller type 1 domain-containing protein n=1 Tax=Datura stramonium TaxID=4076 RepID=A0ABS8TN12_DATST|nr:hypothetical protein [Datura stramonium]